MRILLIRNDNIGDLICTTPAIEGLRKRFPEAEIEIVVNSYNRVVVEGNRFIDRIWSYTKPKHKKGLGEKVKAGVGKLELFWQLARRSYDIGIVFRSGFSSSAYQFLQVARPRRRLGIGPASKFTDPRPPVKNLHEVLLCFHILKPLGIEYQGERCYFPIAPDLRDRFKNYPPGIAIHISSRLPENRFTPAQLQALIYQLTPFSLPLYLTAAPSDWKVGEQMEGAQLVKTGGLKELGVFLSQMKLFISLDGGALHLGGAVGTPTVSLFGRTNPDRWSPWGYHHLALKSPTGRVADIPVEAVVEKVAEGLGRG